jgi:hypothetical protein
VSVEEVLLAWELPAYGGPETACNMTETLPSEKKEEFGVETEEMKGEEF